MRERQSAQALRNMGAELVVGDLLDLESMHRAIAGCDTMYFGGMLISGAYLAATVNAASVAKHHGVKAFINMSQMTLSQMGCLYSQASTCFGDWLTSLHHGQRERAMHEVPTVFSKDAALTSIQ